jgi:hypothetical protein
MSPDIPLSREQVALLIDALDSHQYWQLSPPERRNSGSVLEPLTDEERECDELADYLQGFVPTHAVECDMDDDCTCGAES